MKLICVRDGTIHAAAVRGLSAMGTVPFFTGLTALDALSPGGGFARGAVHEVLSERGEGAPRFFALLLARSAARGVESRPAGAIVWSDPGGDLYPPALLRGGLPAERLFLLRTGARDEVWAIAQCLRCKGVEAAVASLPRLSRIQARRLQLAAESGGGVGILLRQADTPSLHYAAATRWLVRPAPGEAAVQRWSVQLIHGHGGRLGQSVLLEVCHDTGHVQARPDAARAASHPVRAADVLADRPDSAQAARVPA